MVHSDTRPFLALPTVASSSLDFTIRSTDVHIASAAAARRICSTSAYSGERTRPLDLSITGTGPIHPSDVAALRQIASSIHSASPSPQHEFYPFHGASSWRIRSMIRASRERCGCERGRVVAISLEDMRLSGVLAAFSTGLSAGRVASRITPFQARQRTGEAEKIQLQNNAFTSFPTCLTIAPSSDGPRPLQTSTQGLHRHRRGAACSAAHQFNHRNRIRRSKL